MRLLMVIVALALLPVSSAWGGILTYRGSDAGRIVFSIAESSDGSNGGIRLKYRRVDAKGKGEIWGAPTAYYPGPDFSFKPPTAPPSVQAEGKWFGPHKMKALVLSEPLPPGRYELYALEVGGMQYSSLTVPLSAPFEVRTGRSTYLGAFEAYTKISTVPQSLLQRWTAPNQIFFSFHVRDMSERDLPLARARHKDLGEVDAQVSLQTQPPFLADLMFTSDEPVDK